MAKKRKTDTSWQVKARYNAKAYKGVSMQLKPEVFEGLEKACKEEELSRPELIKTLLEEKQRRKELKELKQELELKAKSTEGLWAYALNKRLADVFPHLPEEEKWQPIKVYWREDSVHVYGIWNNGLPIWTFSTMQPLPISKRWKEISDSAPLINPPNTSPGRMTAR